jgi:hypothetical protein
MTQTAPAMPRSRAGTRVITKIFVSFLFGGVAFVMTRAIESDIDSIIVLGIGVSIFVGGVAFVVQFLIGSENRIHSLDQTIQTVAEAQRNQQAITQSLIKEEFKKVSAATEPFDAVDASALKTDVVIQLVRHATAFTRDDPLLVRQFAQDEIARLSGYLRDLSQQADLVYDGEDRDWMLGLTRAASVSIDATSLTTVDAGGGGVVDGGLWSSDLGQRYLEAQKGAFARGVTIRRIFILDGDRRDQEDFVSLLRDHLSIGVEVRTLDPRTLNVTQRALLVDLIIIDGILVYQSQPAAQTDRNRPRIIETRLVSHPDRVRRSRERYEELWRLAIPFEPGDDQTNA